MLPLRLNPPRLKLIQLHAASPISVHLLEDGNGLLLAKARNPKDLTIKNGKPPKGVS
jgi:hypothetical protein